MREREILYYQMANIDLVKRELNEFDQEKVFSSFDVDKMVYIFNKTVINILCDFIPPEGLI